jgi:uncharacterized protein YuzE
MKLNYHPETDSLYIDLSERASVEGGFTLSAEEDSKRCRLRAWLQL